MLKTTLLAGVAMVLLGATASQAQVNEVDIGINPAYQQTGATTVVSEGGFFSARAFMDSASDFDGGSLTYPGAGSPASLTLSPGAVLSYAPPPSSSLAALNAAFPTGTYTFTATNSSTSASQTDSIDYVTPGTTTSIPTLTAASYNALQGLNAGSSVNVDFNAFDQNSADNLSYIYVNVYNSSNVDVFTESQLSPSTTSFVLPGGVLAAGQDYTLDLLFDERETGTDGTVPTTIFFDTHTQTAFSTAISAAPEPSSWALMLLGVGGIGYAARRAKRSQGASFA